MRVLVIGSQGQLARSLVERARGRPNIELIAIGRPKIDLERPRTIAPLIAEIAADVVINTAAYTAVDQAEDEPERAFRINADAAGEVAAATAGKARLIQISTDYVFDGKAQGAYAEGASTNPLNVYGRSKLAGEDQVRAANPEHMIVRTSWVYSPFGRNFVKTMMAAAQRNAVLRVVDDQRGCPSSALDLADGLLRVAETWADGGATGLGSTFHLAGSGETSWCGFARAVMEECRARGLPSVAVEAIRSDDWPTKAQRPRNSVLDSSKFERDFDFRMPEGRSSLGEVVARLAEPS